MANAGTMNNVCYPQVDVLKQKCQFFCHVSCMLPSELIWEEVAPPHKRNETLKGSAQSEYYKSLLISCICEEIR